MISERHPIPIKPAPKIAGCLVAIALVPALALVQYGAPIIVILAIGLVSIAVVTPAAWALWRPQRHVVLNGSELIASDRSRHIQFRGHTLRAVVTPWAVSVWSPWRRGLTVFRCQMDDQDYRRLAAWLHR